MIESFRQAVELAIKSQLSEIEDELVKEYADKFKKKVGHVIANVAFELHKQMSFSMDGNELVVRVIMKEIK